MPIIRKRAKDTLTAVEMDEGDVLEFTRLDGSVARLELLATEAEVIRTTLKELGTRETAARTDFQFRARVRVDGDEHTLEREVSTQRSFYEPWEIAGLRIWFDVADRIFDFLHETHAPCRTNRVPRGKRTGEHFHARFALQDAAATSICPEPLHPWCPLPEGGLKIEQCYRGEDCWLGAYDGASAHGGLDINHPAGTPLWAPLDIDDHFYFDSVEMGHNNNRWRGIRHWPNGAVWILQAHHMTRLTVPEHEPIAKGQQFAEGAGVLSGAAEHSHFNFAIHDEGETVLLDPWILFWQMYRDRA